MYNIFSKSSNVDDKKRKNTNEKPFTSIAHRRDFNYNIIKRFLSISQYIEKDNKKNKKVGGRRRTRKERKTIEDKKWKDPIYIKKPNG